MTGQRLRILVVEDHDHTRQALVHFLVALGHWVESCPDAETALARLDYDGLDVLLTDVYLPDARDLDYLGELSKRGKLPPRVISMSPGDDLAAHQRSKSSGCASHLVKPVTEHALEAALRGSS